MGAHCKRHLPPGVRNERNPHYRAPPTAAVYDDGCATCAQCSPWLQTCIWLCRWQSLIVPE